MTTEREQKLELDIAALRAEASILMDLVNEIPDDVLEKLDSGKMLRAYQAMSEADKHKTTQTRIDRLAEENDRLRDIVTRVRKWAVITNNMQAIDVLANRDAANRR